MKKIQTKEEKKKNFEIIYNMAKYSKDYAYHMYHNRPNDTCWWNIHQECYIFFQELDKYGQDNYDEEYCKRSGNDLIFLINLNRSSRKFMKKFKISLMKFLNKKSKKNKRNKKNIINKRNKRNKI